MLIDSHAHLDMAAFNKDREQVIERAREAGVRAIITVGIDMPSSQAAVRLAESHEDVFAAVGIHPHSASRFRESDLEVLRELCLHPKVIAIGETGLDFYRNLSPREQQMAAFKKQLGLAREVGLPVIVHSREAHPQVVAILSEHSPGANGSLKGVIHCFGGDAELARRYLDIGYTISFSGSITYNLSPSLEGAVRSIPADRLLVETDAPFLSPHPQRRQRNEPARVSAVAARLAQIRRASFETIAQQTTEAARALFRLEPASGKGVACP